MASTPNPFITKALADSHKLLSKGAALTQSVEGNPTSHFAPPPLMKHITGVKAAPVHEYSEAPYALAHDLNAKSENVKQYTDANPK